MKEMRSSLAGKRTNLDRFKSWQGPRMPLNGRIAVVAELNGDVSPLKQLKGLVAPTWSQIRRNLVSALRLILVGDYTPAFQLC